MFAAMLTEQILGYLPSSIHDVITDVLYFFSIRIYAECLRYMGLQMSRFVFV